MTFQASSFTPAHFAWSFSKGVAVVTINRPERKNPLTFESYAELRNTFDALARSSDVKAVVITGAGENFSSGGDVHEIIGPLIEREMPGLLDFTRLTGDLVKSIRRCGQPVVAAIDGICAGAGAILAMASDIRLATPRAKTAFLFSRVGLAGCDMGACAVLPRLIGFGRATELLLTGRFMSADEGERWGFHNRIVEPEQLMPQALALARELADGPTFAHGITKTQLNQEWNVSLEAAIEMEAQAQALCMATRDFRRAYAAFVDRRVPKFKGD
jgi:enoyl-CoA hydratase/carnithine racemase